MIKNNKQLSVTKKRIKEFEDALKKINDEAVGSLLDKIMSESVESQLDTLKREVAEYQYLQEHKPNIIFSPIEDIPESLVKARILKGMSQQDLANRLGLKEQQIQRYEANNYEGASFAKVLSIAKIMDVHFDGTKIFVTPQHINVKGYDLSTIQQATHKLQSRKSLFAVL